MESKHEEAARSRNRRGSRAIPKYQRPVNSTRPKRRKVADAESQRARIMAHLVEHGSLSTIEARAFEPCIMSPASRIFELRADGVDIITVHDERQQCGRYFLVRHGGGEHGE